MKDQSFDRLKPDLVFEKFTFEEYLRSLPDLSLKKEVPDDVVKNFDIVKKLLVHGYFEYKFIDEAYHKSLTTFEMAMNIRNKELCGHSRNLKFPQLIQSLTSKNAFEVDIEKLKPYKNSRDYFAHPHRHSFAGVFYEGLIQPVAAMINQMYEDRDLREQRKSMLAGFRGKQEKLGLDKTVVYQEGRLALQFYLFKLLFIDNKGPIPIYNFAAVKPFLVSQKPMIESVICPRVELIRLTGCEIREEKILAKTSKGARVIVRQISEAGSKDFNFWLSNLSSNEGRFLYDHSIMNDMARLHASEFWKFLKKHV